MWICYVAMCSIFLILQFISLVKNLTHAWLDWKQYSNARESILQIVRLFLISVNFIILKYYPEDMNHLAAWIVVCTSVELFILLGRLPAIGIYIYMSLSVLKTVVLFVIIYSPVLLGFTTAFYTLRHTVGSFENYFNAFLRVNQ